MGDCFKCWFCSCCKTNKHSLLNPDTLGPYWVKKMFSILLQKAVFRQATLQIQVKISVENVYVSKLKGLFPETKQLLEGVWEDRSLLILPSTKTRGNIQQDIVYYMGIFMQRVRILLPTKCHAIL